MSHLGTVRRISAATLPTVSQNCPAESESVCHTREIRSRLHGCLPVGTQTRAGILGFPPFVYSRMVLSVVHKILRTGG